uniref:HMG box domain-containing protein n=1 Tax=Poecilia formosa TaxID=48698 RepID=A0A096M4V5_POEFO
VSSALPEFSVDATVPVRYNNDQDNVFGPSPLTFLPPAPSAPPPPSIQPNVYQIFHHPNCRVYTVSHHRRVRDQRDDGRPYVKKPPNAFMLFLKEIRPKVVSELNINRSVMVNRFVGEMWNSLAVEVKARYFEKARLEQRLHQQQHPGWSTNDNYGKKRKRVKNKTSSFLCREKSLKSTKCK